MKSAQELFSHIKLVPEKKLAEYACKKAVLAFIPPSYERYVSLIFVKNGTLYVRLNHEGVVFDMDYKLKSLKATIISALKSIGCDEMRFEKIRVYYEKQAEKPTLKATWLEKERSSGGFDNMLQNDTLRSIMEDVRRLICKRDL